MGEILPRVEGFHLEFHANEFIGRHFAYRKHGSHFVLVDYQVPVVELSYNRKKEKENERKEKKRKYVVDPKNDKKILRTETSK